MKFLIQANSPECTMNFDKEDYSLATAIETVFPLITEDAILMWHHLCIPLSYKYDVSCMMEDILKMLYKIRTNLIGELPIIWSSDAFASKWIIKWNEKDIFITSEWENVVGQVQKLLNSKNEIIIEKKSFMSEWKKILDNVLIALKKCGYDEKLQGMSTLIREFDEIIDYGVLYQEYYSKNELLPFSWGETFTDHGSHHEVTRLKNKIK